jgi:hypothetical protein
VRASCGRARDRPYYFHGFSPQRISRNKPTNRLNLLLALLICAVWLPRRAGSGLEQICSTAIRKTAVVPDCNRDGCAIPPRGSTHGPLRPSQPDVMRIWRDPRTPVSPLRRPRRLHLHLR